MIIYYSLWECSDNLISKGYIEQLLKWNPLILVITVTYVNSVNALGFTFIEKLFDYRIGKLYSFWRKTILIFQQAISMKS